MSGESGWLQTARALSAPAKLRPRRLREGLAAATAAMLNLAVLGAPLAWADRSDAATWLSVAAFLGVATLFYCVDLRASWRADATYSAPQPGDLPALRAALCGSLLILATFALGVVERVSQVGNRFEALESLGLFLMLFGCLLRFLAIQALAARFRTETTVSGEFALHTSGVYAIVRHPSEIGLLLLLVGSACLLNSRGGAVLALLQLPLIAWRVRIENKSFEQALGPIFHRYREQVAAFVPLLF